MGFAEDEMIRWLIYYGFVLLCSGEMHLFTYV